MMVPVARGSRDMKEMPSSDPEWNFPRGQHKELNILHSTASTNWQHEAFRREIKAARLMSRVIEMVSKMSDESESVDIDGIVALDH
jgi:hypothetical protein